LVRALSCQSWTYPRYVTPLCSNLLWFCWLPMISSCVESKSDSIKRLTSHMYALAWTSTLSEYGSCIIFDTKALIGGAVTTQRGIPHPPLIYQGRQRVKCLTLRRLAAAEAQGVLGDPTHTHAHARNGTEHINMHAHAPDAQHKHASSPKRDRGNRSTSNTPIREKSPGRQHYIWCTETAWRSNPNGLLEGPQTPRNHKEGNSQLEPGENTNQNTATKGQQQEDSHNKSNTQGNNSAGEPQEIAGSNRRPPLEAHERNLEGKTQTSKAHGRAHSSNTWDPKRVRRDRTSDHTSETHGRPHFRHAGATVATAHPLDCCTTREHKTQS